MASTYLSYSEAATPTNQTKFTWSGWIKRGNISTDQTIYYNYVDASNYAYMYFRTGDDIRYFDRVSGGDTCVVVLDQLFRDTSGWYHLVLKVDTTQVTGTDRVKFYVNGVEAETTFSNTPPQEQALSLPAAGTRTIGASNGGSNYFDGSMSYVNFVDSTAFAPTEFGEVDSTTGEWKITTDNASSYGNGGFFVLKNGSSLTDESGNGNDFSLSGGTLTNTEDCPDDVFCTMNQLDNYGASSTFSNGGNTVAIGTNDRANTSTLGMSKGKFYFEVKYTPGSQIYSMIGISNYAVGSVNATTSGYLTHTAVGNWGYSIQGGGASTSNYARKSENNVASNTSPYPAAGYADNQLVADDIVQVAIDLDNNAIWWGKNGLGYWGPDGYNGDPAANTNGFAIADPSTIDGGTYYVACGRSDSGGVTWAFNFGNGYFGTTAISSEGTNASGIGKFEYDVPTGFTALSTKGLNS